MVWFPFSSPRWKGKPLRKPSARSIFAPLSGLVLAAGIAGCGNVDKGQTPASNNAKGAPSVVHPTIVSLNPCTDAILAEVTTPGQLLAISNYSHDPAATSMDITQAMRYPSLSGSVEEILAIDPDVVVASTYLDPATLHALRKLGMKVVLIPIASTVPQSEGQVHHLANLAGHSGRGDALVQRIEDALARATPPRGNRPISAMIWETGGIVAGSDTLLSHLLDRTGFSNAAAAQGLTQADFVPLEQLLAHPPRVILAERQPAAAEDRMLAHPALTQLKATARADFSGNLVWCGGPTIIRAAARLAQIRQGILAQGAFGGGRL